MQLERQINGVPEKEKQLKTELGEAEEDLKLAKGAVSFYDTYLRLENQEIPKLENDMKVATAKVTEANKGVDQRIAAVSELKVELKSLENLRKPVQEIMRYTKEIDDLTREITGCESQLGESGRSLTGAEIRAKMDELNEQRSKLQREQKSLLSEKDKARTRIQGLKDQISQMKFRLGEGENKLNAKVTFTRDLEDARTQLRKAQEEIKVQLSMRETLI